MIRNRIVKRRGQLQAVIEPGAPNAETLVELMPPDGRYRLTPRTGRTHQLRLHMASLGLPTFGDPLCPNVIDVPAGDFSTPLRLLAQRIEFDDPRPGRGTNSSVRETSRSRYGSCRVSASRMPCMMRLATRCWRAGAVPRSYTRTDRIVGRRQPARRAQPWQRKARCH